MTATARVIFSEELVECVLKEREEREREWRVLDDFKRVLHSLRALGRR